MFPKDYLFSFLSITNALTFSQVSYLSRVLAAGGKKEVG
jgi:hypothetical protein